MKKSFADILGSLDESRERKLSAKLPGWAAAGCRIPTGLSLEQCSSEVTAAYKASLIRLCAAADTDGINRSPMLADLTGGLGVDSHAFSRVCGKVSYFERDETLAAAAADNFGLLGVSNIEVHCATVDSDSELPECDWIFIDPARRAADGSGKKVFLLEDCTPDVLMLLPMLWSKAGRIMLKLSPMADITMVASRLCARCREVTGKTCLREIHVVGVSGEVKELLCLMDRDWNAGWTITAVSLDASGYASSVLGALTFSPEEEASAEARYCSAAELEAGAASYLPAGVAGGTAPAPSPYAHSLLLEPDPVLLKAGAFKLPCSRFGLKKLDRFTHLYLSGSPAPAQTADAGSDTTASLAPASAPAPAADTTPAPSAATPTGAPAPGLFKAYRILEVHPFDKAAIKELGSRFHGADVTARNLPLTSDALRARLRSSNPARSGKASPKATAMPASPSIQAASAPAADTLAKTYPAAELTSATPATGNVHIFGLTASGTRLLLVTGRIAS